MRRLVFRADGSSVTGMGHIMRCVALSQMLNDHFQMSFATFDADEKIIDLLLGSNLNVIKLDKKEELNYIKNQDAIVLDGYWYNDDYIKTVKESPAKVIQVDDLCGAAFFSDIIINHAIDADYSSSVFTDCKYLLTGSEYALLRKEFLEASQENRYHKNIRSVTISMGGADPHNFTLDLLHALKQTISVDKINILIGGAYSHKQNLYEFINNNARMTIEVKENLNAAEMISLLRSSSLFICSASTVVYEALATKVPVLCFLTAENQKKLYQGLLNTKSVEGLGSMASLSGKELQDNLSECFLKYDQLVRIADEQHVIDGQSGKRILEAVKSLWN